MKLWVYPQNAGPIYAAWIKTLTRVGISSARPIYPSDLDDFWIVADG